MSYKRALQNVFININKRPKKLLPTPAPASRSLAIRRRRSPLRRTQAGRSPRRASPNNHLFHGRGALKAVRCSSRRGSPRTQEPPIRSILVSRITRHKGQKGITVPRAFVQRSDVIHPHRNHLKVRKHQALERYKVRKKE